MKYVVLGSSASLPSKERNCPGSLLTVTGEQGLVDCGDGTTRQLILFGHALQKTSWVWISHPHVDHYIGLASLIRCLDLVAPHKVLKVFGSDETITEVDCLMRLCRQRSVAIETCSIGEGIFYETKECVWRSFKLRHTVPALGLIVQEKASRPFIPERAEKIGIPVGPMRGRLARGRSVVLPGGRRIEPDEVLGAVRPGRKFVYIADTEMFDDLVPNCEGADLLVCEATFTREDVELARKYKHMTAKDAALLARDAGARQLILTHISPRVESASAEKEARAIFDNARVAVDGVVVEIPHR